MTNIDLFQKGYKGLFDIELIDLFPNSSVQTQCLSYAFKKSMEEILKYSDRLCLLSDVDNLPEQILDYLAVEYMLPYYDGDFDIETKRKLVKDGKTWPFRAGTVDGLNKLIQNLFGNGRIVEWFDFDDVEDVNEWVGYFDVEITGAIIGEESLERLETVLKRAKNESRWIRKVVSNCDTEQKVFFVNRTTDTDRIIIN